MRQPRPCPRDLNVVRCLLLLNLLLRASSLQSALPVHTRLAHILLVPLLRALLVLFHAVSAFAGLCEVAKQADELDQTVPVLEGLHVCGLLQQVLLEELEL